MALRPRGGGPYVHSYSWTVDVNNWRPSPDSAPGKLHLDNRPRWLLSATAGLTASYKSLSIEHQYFHNAAPHGEDVPPIWHDAHVLMAKYRFCDPKSGTGKIRCLSTEG